MEFIVPCHFGLEAVLKKEIEGLGYHILETEDGRVTFEGEISAIARANIFLRTGERVLLKVGDFKAFTFEELYQRTKAIPWKTYLPKDAAFWVTKASSVKSRLFSTSDIQSVMKKAMVDSMKEAWHLPVFPENGAKYPVRVFLYKDRVTVGLDTTGESLHKRGYRKNTTKAPLSETLAAALLMLTPWKRDRILVDPFCGSGTFAIEAALLAKNEAPGMNREFTAEAWTNLLPKKVWYQALEEAEKQIIPPEELHTDIQAYDTDPEAIRMAKANAALAGVEDMIHFQVRDVKDLSHRKPYGFIVTNPPYGERLQEKEELFPVYRSLGDAFRKMENWSLYMLTNFEDAEKAVGRSADKKRKIYNGMIQTCFYQFIGKKPPGRREKKA